VPGSAVKTASRSRSAWLTLDTASQRRVRPLATQSRRRLRPRTNARGVYRNAPWRRLDPGGRDALMDDASAEAERLTTARSLDRARALGSACSEACLGEEEKIAGKHIRDGSARGADRRGPRATPRMPRPRSPRAAGPMLVSSLPHAERLASAVGAARLLHVVSTARICRERQAQRRAQGRSQGPTCPDVLQAPRRN